MNLIQSNNLKNIPSITHGFGVRGIDLSQYLDHFKIKQKFIPTTNQIHGNIVHVLTKPLPDKLLQGDAFITNLPDTICFVRTADCVPILIAEPKKKVVAAIHAGWRGTADDIVGETVSAMIKNFGINAKDCVAAVGPRICGNCYEVGNEVVIKLESLKIGNDWKISEKKIDLSMANNALLLKSGLQQENIEILPYCTSCDETFASYRRDKSETERQFNFIYLKGCHCES